MRRTATHGFSGKNDDFLAQSFCDQTSSRTHEIAPLTARYVKLLRQNAFGNFQDFVRAIGLDITMLLVSGRCTQ